MCARSVLNGPYKGHHKYHPLGGPFRSREDRCGPGRSGERHEAARCLDAAGDPWDSHHFKRKSKRGFPRENPFGYDLKLNGESGNGYVSEH